MIHFRIRPLEYLVGCPTNPKSFVVDEIVTPRGHYITTGLFNHVSGALNYIRAITKGDPFHLEVTNHVSESD